MAQRLSAGGARVQVWANGQIVGLATGATYDEDFGVVPAEVIGIIGPIDYDSQNYSCSLSLATFVPEVPDGGPWPDGGTKTIEDFIPLRKTIQGNAGKPGQIDLLQFINNATGEIVNQFSKVMIASNGEQIQARSYLTKNVRMFAVSRDI